MKTRLTLRPGNPGTKSLLAEYGERLVCVRYRYDDQRQKRIKTVELVVEEVDLSQEGKPRSSPPTVADTRRQASQMDLVDLTVQLQETDVQARLRAAGGRWNPDTCTWRVSRRKAEELNLTCRIVRRHQKVTP